MKTCTRCGETKPVTEFSKKATGRDGLRSHCKTCVRTTSAAYRAAANPDKVRATNAKWRADNPEKCRAYRAKYRAANPEKERVRIAEWAAANRERGRARSAKWYADNPEATRINCHNRRALKRELGGKLSNGLAERLFKLQRGKCACGCKQPLGTDYHRDHIIPLALGGTNTDDNMQLLTATCNLSKGAKHPIDFMQQRGFLI